MQQRPFKVKCTLSFRHLMSDRHHLVCRIKLGSLALVFCALMASCTTGPSVNQPGSTNQAGCHLDRTWLHEGLLSTLWVQTSAEYSIATRATYAQATRVLNSLLMNSDHTAVNEQRPPFAGKPPAIIMDIDETVLDNSPFQAQLVLDGARYSKAAWKAWTSQANADWVPGAKDFIDAAYQAGVVVFFVTNRSHGEEKATRDNLRNRGLALPAEPDYLLTKNEHTDWTSDKHSRRAHVAQNYRVVMVMGDDLNDFLSAPPTPEQRHAAALENAAHFGTDWFLLPNPGYGSWERSLFNSSDACEELAQKRRHLVGTQDY